MTKAEKLLRELIALPSVNPAFAPAGDAGTGEKLVGEFLMATLKRSGLDAQRHPVFPGRENIVARLIPRQKPTRRILLAPHLDTVGVPDETLLRPIRKNGRLYGRGACDTKGNIAAMVTALLSVAQAGPRPARTEIVFVGLVDEEYGQCGSRALAATGFKADLAIVGEPTQLRVVTAHKGDVWLRLETRGKSAHGARPELGRNAVHAMAKIVHLLETEYAAQLRRRRHPLLGHPTVNVGSIAGGTQPNIVPAHCAVGIDRRTLPGETETSVRQEVRAFLKRHRQSANLGNAKTAECLPLDTPLDLRLVREFLQCVGQTKAAGVDFFCDAAVLAAAGIPSVVFGAGNIAQAHTADEWISLRSLEAGTRILARYLQSLP
ncbi:MAG: M20 family metallopeptidase [Verrucomicrobia bacterium]|nr:M20 family metallopeptidase [Verrucomicrobiota bacterium]